MTLTQEQKEELKKIDKRLKSLFSDMYGNIQFNLAPHIKEVNVNFNLKLKN